MTATTTRRAARTTVARAATRPARNTAGAVTTRPAPVARITTVTVDGGEPVAVPFALSDFVNASDFVRDVVTSIVWAHTGLLTMTLDHVGSTADRGTYAGAMKVGKGATARLVRFVITSRVVEPKPAPAPVTSAETVAPVDTGTRTLVDTPRLAIVSVGLPARKPATPQVDALPGMSPLGLSPAPAPAREVKTLPAPQMCLDLKAASEVARIATAPETVRITLEGEGCVDVQASTADLADRARFAREVVGPIVSRFREWPRVTLETVNATGRLAYRAAFAHATGRQVATWCIVPATATLTMPLPARKGAGAARGVDALAAAMGLKPAGHHVATAEARAKAAGIRLSRTDRAAAEALDAAGRRVEAGTVKADAAPRMSAGNRAMFEAAEAGTLPPAPDFTAETHTRYRPKLAALVALVAVGDVAGLEAYPINPISTSPKALNKYRNAAVIALRAIAARKA